MRFIKSLIILTLMLSILPVAFANKTSIRLKKSMQDQVYLWKFTTRDDGMFFILGEDSPYKLQIQVKPLVDGGLPADPVTVYCNAQTYRLAPGGTQICEGNLNDVIFMQIEPQDFQNGAEGDYQYKLKA